MRHHLAVIQSRIRLHLAERRRTSGIWVLVYRSGPNCYTGEGIGISNKPELCGQEINDYYTSEKNDALISCGGGELMCEILNYVDFDRLRAADPKWFMGYSDNTNITFPAHDIVRYGVHIWSVCGGIWTRAVAPISCGCYGGPSGTETVICRI